MSVLTKESFDAAKNLAAGAAAASKLAPNLLETSINPCNSFLANVKLPEITEKVTPNFSIFRPAATTALIAPTNPAGPRRPTTFPRPPVIVLMADMKPFFMAPKTPPTRNLRKLAHAAVIFFKAPALLCSAPLINLLKDSLMRLVPAENLLRKSPYAFVARRAPCSALVGSTTTSKIDCFVVM